MLKGGPNEVGEGWRFVDDMEHQLYNADKQYALATNAFGNNPKGFLLPEGELYRGNDPGIIEDK